MSVAEIAMRHFGIPTETDGAWAYWTHPPAEGWRGALVFWRRGRRAGETARAREDFLAALLGGNRRIVLMGDDVAAACAGLRVSGAAGREAGWVDSSRSAHAILSELYTGLWCMAEADPGALVGFAGPRKEALPVAARLLALKGLDWWLDSGYDNDEWRLWATGNSLSEAEP